MPGPCPKMTVNGGVQQEILEVFSPGLVAFCIPWWQMNNEARWTIGEGTGWKRDIKGGMWEFESHTSFLSTTMSCRLLGGHLSNITVVYYDYYLPQLLSTSTKVYLLLGRLLGLLLGKNSIFSVIMRRSSLSHVICWDFGLTSIHWLLHSGLPMVGVQWYTLLMAVGRMWSEWSQPGHSGGVVRNRLRMRR